MKQTGIFYATISGSTKRVAEMMAFHLALPASNVYNIAKTPVEVMLNYDVIILGTPTYGKGDLHYVWSEIFEEMKAINLADKTFALFCLGDQKFHGNTFAGSLVKMNDKLMLHSKHIIGASSSDSYSFEFSPSLLADKTFPGLVIDEVNQSELTALRIGKWIEQLNSSLG